MHHGSNGWQTHPGHLCGACRLYGHVYREPRHWDELEGCPCCIAGHRVWSDDHALVNECLRP